MNGKFMKIVFFALCCSIVLATKSCPYVDPRCKCALRDLCKSDDECKNGQKCCLDCCGGHKCTEPVEICEKKCTKANESYLSCGTACPPTCENPAPTVCTEQCVEGCFCKKGYLRRNDGECVKQKDCRK